MGKRIDIKMIKIGEVDNERYTLEVWECSCGYHMGFDVTYLEQIGPIKAECPSCGDFLLTEKEIKKRYDYSKWR